MQQSDKAAFNSIYTEYSFTLRKLARRYGLPKSEVEDIVQDTFLAYFAHYPIDWEEKKMKAMLTRILKNKCIDYSRKCWSKHTSLDAELEDEGYNKVVKVLVSKDSLSIVLEREEHRKFWSVMSQMRNDWQEVFILYFVQDYSIKEVSEILDISENACRTRISRGRKYLKDELKRSPHLSD